MEEKRMAELAALERELKVGEEVVVSANRQRLEELLV